MTPDNTKAKNTKKDWLEYFNPSIKFAYDDSNPWTAYTQGSSCCDGHQTFYGAIMKSPQWNAWYEEQMKRFRELKLNEKTNQYEGKPTFDIDECIGIGAIGDEHLQEFFKFIEDLQ